MTEHARKHDGGERLAVGVVGHHGVVKGLASKGYPVFRAGHFFTELHHVLISF